MTDFKGTINAGIKYDSISCMLSPKCWTHFSLSGHALPPMLWCITYYSCKHGFISNFINCYGTPLSPKYKKEMFSF